MKRTNQEPTLLADVVDQLIKNDSQLRFIPSLASLAQQYIAPLRIVLFGSRARGDHSKTSDVDIAFVVPDHRVSKWPRFVAEAEDTLKTLLKLDLVRMDRASEELQSSIEEEGIVIYE